jgi:hypothetical protein
VANHGKPRELGSRRIKGTAEQDYKAAMLWAMGMPLAKIAEIIGVKTEMGASRAVSRGQRDNAPANLDEIRATAGMELIALKRELWEQAHAVNYAYSSGTGQLIRGPGGEPLIDYSENNKARALLIRANERFCKLYGADARQQIDVGMPQIEAMIAAMETQVAEAQRNRTPITAPAPARAAIEATPADSEPDGDNDNDDQPRQPEQSYRPPRRGTPLAPTDMRPDGDGSRRSPQDEQAEAQDYAAAYRPPQPQPEQQVTEPAPGWHKSERITSWS